MKSKLPLLSNVFVFIVGLLLVVLHNRAAILEMIIIIVGIMFIVPSCLALIALFARKEKRMMSGVAGVPIVGGLILGIALVAAPQFFVGFTAYTFAIVLILGGCLQIVGTAVVEPSGAFPDWLLYYSNTDACSRYCYPFDGCAAY